MWIFNEGARLLSNRFLEGDAMVTATITGTTENRRAGARFLQPGGTAICHTGTTSQRYCIQDASRSGVALGGAALEIGAPVTLQLWWPLIGSATAQGVVCRRDPQTNSVGVKYTDDRGVGELVQKLSAIALLRRTAPRPLFCGESAILRRVMEQLADAGFQYEYARTPLEALIHVQDPWKPLTTAVCTNHSRWSEFSNFLSAEHPMLRRLVLDDNGDLFAADSQGYEEVLARPWHPIELYRILGLQIHEDPCICCGAPMPKSAEAFCGVCVGRSSELSEFDDLGEGD